ncbi:4'-phosphopantetheinyl transferase superfamily protein [Streptomyces sp. NBC_00704]|uniref:4'-phosphopantetheinyl transferase superfamily protein n=1 Tax=Streptomyces sp. NBC_00704 TaxID=2975809 RepID=UPI002E31BD6E|nr:4'-phosphopantetheinyl transferase superfamily protein [Streptomyces sp. NBC_00704]
MPVPVHVWWAALADARPGLLALLDPVERRRHDATVDPADRGRFLVGCALSRIALAGPLGMPAADVPLRRVCPRCGGPHGKVRLEPPPRGGPWPDFSVAHSGTVIGVAVCENGRVGLDVEDADLGLDVDTAARVALAAPELAALHRRPPAARKAAFLRTWTRKEAVLKALGVGLGVPLRALQLSDPEHPPTVLTWPGQLAPASAAPPHMTLTDLLAHGTHPAAVAVTNSGAPATEGDEAPPDGVHITLRDGSAALAEYLRTRDWKTMAPDTAREA